MLSVNLKQLVLVAILTLGLFIPASPDAVSSPRHIVALPVASYNIQVTLDTNNKMLAAREVITYTNMTKTPFKDLVFHLYLNAFRDKNSIFLKESGSLRGFSWDEKNPGWVKINSLRVRGGSPLTVNEIEDGTLARADLPSPVAPGETITLELEYQAQLPKVFARTGFAKDFFMVGQWFPKLGVWQDAGWNAYPFHANSEFFSDFGTYDVTITMPKNYVVGATGMPTKAKENGDDTRTVSYHAENVIDFAWAASPRFKSATRRVGNTELMYLYLSEHENSVARILNAAESAFKLFNQWYGEYPYTRLTIVDVPSDGEGAGGMEYPTLITAGSLGASTGFDRLAEVVVVHEIGHQWWQSMVAFNEAEEPWLDEGFADYSTLRAMDAVYGANTSFVNTPSLTFSYLDMRRSTYLVDPRVKMYGKAWDFSSSAYGNAAYTKPVLALRTMENILGDETMVKIMGTFFRRYQFAHPTTEDFHVVAEEVSRQDLSWFFDGLVYSDGVLNYSVSQVDEHSATVRRQGELIIPTDVLITFNDNTTITELWDGKISEVTFTYPTRIVQRAEVDPKRKIVVDLRWTDNGLSRKADVGSWAAIAVRVLYVAQNMLLVMGGQ